MLFPEFHWLLRVPVISKIGGNWLRSLHEIAWADTFFQLTPVDYCRLWAEQRYGGPEVQITTANRKTQQQIRKHNSKSQITTANRKTQQQIRKQNSKSQNTTANHKTQQH